MKKALSVTILAVLLLAALCACGRTTPAPDPTTAPPGNTTAAPAPTKAANPADPWEQLEGSVKLEQNILYIEKYTSGSDPGENLTPQQGAELVLRDLITDDLRGLITDEVCIFISYDNLETLGDIECYIYNVSVGTVEDWQLDRVENKLLAAVDYQSSFAGLYDDMSGIAGGDDFPGWWGLYTDNETAINIGNFNAAGTAFRFSIYVLETDEELLSGMAVLDPDDRCSATFGDIAFYLYEDDDIVEFRAADGSEFANLWGQYRRAEP